MLLLQVHHGYKPLGGEGSEGHQGFNNLSADVGHLTKWSWGTSHTPGMALSSLSKKGESPWILWRPCNNIHACALKGQRIGREEWRWCRGRDERVGGAGTGGACRADFPT